MNILKTIELYTLMLNSLVSESKEAVIFLKVILGHYEEIGKYRKL